MSREGGDEERGRGVALMLSPLIKLMGRYEFQRVRHSCLLLIPHPILAYHSGCAGARDADKH